MDKEEISPLNLEYVCDLVRTRSAIVLAREKAYLVQSRLEPIAKREGLTGINELVEKLRHSPYGRLPSLVIEAMTTNETSFFRDMTPFQILKDQLLPEIMAHRALTKRLNIWCGASSSGQEPYSIIFTLFEHFPELMNWEISFVATDISEEMLARCREGKYSQMEVNRGLPVRLLTKYFSKRGMGWQIKKEVRDRIEFQPMNLIGTWLPLPILDLVFVRNVMIYFDTETKKDILQKIGKILSPQGYLLLGGSETTINLDDQYERVAVSGTSLLPG